MREKIKLAIVIVMTCLIVIGISLLTKVDAVGLVTHYGGAGAGAFTGEKYLNHLLSSSAYFCNGHGESFFYKRSTTIMLTGSVNGTGVSREVTSGGTFTVWNVSHGSCVNGRSESLKLQATSYSGMSTKISSYCGGNGKKVKATGKTNYTITHSGTYKNDRNAYILNHAPDNFPGLMPASSVPNRAWWSKDKAVSGGIDMDSIDSRPKIKEIKDNANELIAKRKEKIKKLKKERDEAKDDIADWEDENGNVTEYEEVRKRLDELRNEKAGLWQKISDNQDKMEELPQNSAEYKNLSEQNAKIRKQIEKMKKEQIQPVKKRLKTLAKKKVDEDNPSEGTIGNVIGKKLDRIDDIEDEIDKLRQKNAQTRRERDEMVDTAKELNTNIRNNTGKLPSTGAGSAGSTVSQILKEAKIFEAMHKTINGNYANTIKDNTNTSNVTVVYDSSTRKYTVGPFNISYLEVYAGSNQFAGVSTKPVLTLKKDEGTIAKTVGDGWNFAWTGARKKTSSTGDAIPSSYINTVYPHTGETFYLVIDYVEGVNAIQGLKMSFRYLTASAQYQESEGQVEIKQWSMGAVSFSKCNKRIPCPTHKNTDKAHNINCKNYKSATVTVDGPSVVGHADIQPILRVVKADRSYGGFKTIDGKDSGKLHWGIDLTTSIGGNVWEDLSPQKTNNVKIGVKDAKDKGIANIEVTVYVSNGQSKQKAIGHNSAGKRISLPVYTDANGNWSIDRLEAPGLKKNGFYDVEFAYDGQVYRHTVYLGVSSSVNNNIANQGKPNNFKNNTGNYKNSSMAVEKSADRAKFDQSFGEITGSESIKSNNSTNGITHTTNANGTGASGSKALKYTGSSSGGMIASTLDSPAKSTDPKNNKKMNTSYYTRFKMTASTFYEGKADYQIKYPLEKKYVMNAYKSGSKRYISDYMLHINLGLQRRATTDVSTVKDLYKATLVVNEQKLTKQFNVVGEANSGNYAVSLEKRKTSGKTQYSLGLYSTDLSYQSYKRYSDAIQQVKDIKAGTELHLYVTYVVRVYNNSETNNVEFNQITDYYDNSFTLVENETKTSIVDEKLNRNQEVVADAPYYRIMSSSARNTWEETKAKNIAGHQSGTLKWNNSGSANGMKKSTSTTLTSIKVPVNSYVEIFTTYEVDKEGYDKMSKSAEGSINDRNNILGKKYNIAEISNYSTYYTNRDFNGYYTAYSNGAVSGRVDKDSAPNNIDTSNLKNKNKYEDDTDQSLPINISIDTYERDMYGYVWEDTKDKDTGQYSIKTGNGYYNSDTDKLVPNVKVSMYEVINLGKFNTNGSYNSNYDSFDYYYKVPDEYYNYSSKKATDSSDTEVVLTADAKEKNLDGNEVDGNYYIYGFLAGDYVLRYDYGTEKDGNKETQYSLNSEGAPTSSQVDIVKYNGQDYENTGFLGEIGEDHINDKYLDLTGSTKINNTSINNLAISKARDNESRRMVIDAYSRTIENNRGEILRDKSSDEFINATRMFAETPIMQVEIEDPEIISGNNTGGNSYKEKVEYNAENNQVKNHKYSVKNINFGLEERAKTDIALQKYVENISLIKAGETILYAEMDENGEVIIDKDNSSSLDKLSYLSHSKATNKNAGLYQQGFYAISVEDDYMNDLTLRIQYKIKVINQSEVDFTGGLADVYKASEIIKYANAIPTDDLTAKIIKEMNENGAKVGLATNANLVQIVSGDNSNLQSMLTRDNDRIDKEKTQQNNKPAEYLADTIRPQVIIYGRYVGRYYYDNKIHKDTKKYTVNTYENNNNLQPVEVTYNPDKVVKTTIDQLVDYVDNDGSMENDSSLMDAAWDPSGLDADENGYNKSLNGLLSKASYRSVGDKNSLYDDKDREFINSTRSNISISYSDTLAKQTSYMGMYNETDCSSTGRVEYMDNSEHNNMYNSNLTQELAPSNYEGSTPNSAEIHITVRKTAASGVDANQMRIDNLAEVLVYSNSVGRRDTNSVPGNAMAIATIKGFWKAGYESFKPGEGPDDWLTYPENDAWCPEFVTVIAPTGIAVRTYVRNYVVPIAVLVVAMMVMMVGFVWKQIQIRNSSGVEK